jgi:glyoxylase-like metal-dependent hydrolase (beta-lactamase superfamily II)
MRMVSNAATDEIHVFHINVSEGDSTIYLHAHPTVGPKSGYSVEAAVLLDGGTQGPENVEKITDTIKWIEGEYGLKYASKVLKFDSIVLSHWDADHYGGVGEFLAKHLKALKENTEKSAGTLRFEKHNTA